MKAYSTVQRSAIGAILIVSLVVPFTVFTGSAHAIPTNFPDKNACIAELSRVETARGPRRGLGIYTKPELIQYGQARVDIRRAKLQLVDKAHQATRANVNYYNDRVPKVQAAINAMNEAKRDSLTGLANDPAGDANFAVVPGRVTDMGAFDAVYTNAVNVINGAGAVLGSPNPDKASIVNAACSAIFDARIFADLIPLAKKSYILSRIDIQNLMNAGLNVTRKTVQTSVYNTKKATDPSFDAEGTLAASAGYQADPNAQQLELAVLTGWAGGDAVALNNKLNDIAGAISTHNENIDISFGEVLSEEVGVPQPAAQ